MFTVLIILITITIIVVTVIVYLNWHELSLPILNLKDLVGERASYNFLVIYPHPDDETMMSGGLIAKLVKNNKVTLTCISVTQGEKGNEVFKLPPKELAKVRRTEFTKVMTKLGVKKYELWGFSDGGLKKEYSKLYKKLEKYIQAQHVDVVVTYERSGLYGHPDHVALSKIIYELKQKYNNFKTIYATIPSNIMKYLGLPEEMREQEDKSLSNSQAEFKVFIGGQLLKKYFAACEYKSQVLNANAPLIVEMALMPFEYYTTKYT